MGGLKGFCVVQQNPCGQQQGGDIQIALDICIGQIGHQCHSLAARNALAICTGVIVFRTIPTSHLWKCRAVAAKSGSRMSGGPVHIPYARIKIK
ncbi:hypothetical protein FCE86_011550 [Pseudomonas chlororaphis subsp. aureofaciens]|nr:hypothetical protein F7R16_27745 [Pseudomonas chlororaphis subsp. aureofaciens]TSD30174.1 hypothetical protein FCE86_011550 [Pseudomonas sp. ATCC 13985]